MRNRNTPLTVADIDRLDWEKMDGLLPSVVQDRATLQILMLAYVNREALEETIASKKGVFYSRSREALWRKGETSGNWLENVEAFTDCDYDALLILADPAGPTCHLGTASCFSEETAPGLGWLAKLEDIIDQRMNNGGEKSYTRSLVESGVKRVAQKVGEEGVETSLAAVSGKDDELLDEASDLMFHLLVLLKMRGRSLADVTARLRSRHQEKPS